MNELESQWSMKCHFNVSRYLHVWRSWPRYHEGFAAEIWRWNHIGEASKPLFRDLVDTNRSWLGGLVRYAATSVT
jgi:hypothetical protein